MEKVLYIGIDAAYKDKICYALAHELAKKDFRVFHLCTRIKRMWRRLWDMPQPLTTIVSDETDIRSFVHAEDAYRYVHTAQCSPEDLPSVVLIDVDIKKKNRHVRRDDERYQGAQVFFGYEGKLRVPTFILSEQPPEELDGHVPGCYFFSKWHPTKTLVDRVQGAINQNERCRRKKKLVLSQ